MSKLKDFINDIIEQAEIDKEDEGVKSFLEALPEADLPETFEDTFHKTYMTLSAAKNNADVADHFDKKDSASYANAALSEVKKLLPDHVETLEAEKTTTKKIRKAFELLSNHYNDQLEEISKGGKKPDEKTQAKIEELTNQINAIQEEKTQLTEAHEKELKELNSSFDNERINSRISDLMGKYKFATTETITEKDIKTLLKTKFNELPYTIKKVDDNYKVYQKGTDIEAHENNKPVTLDGLVEKISMPFVEKSEPSTPAPRSRSNGKVPEDDNGFVFGQHAKRPA